MHKNSIIAALAALVVSVLLLIGAPAATPAVPTAAKAQPAAGERRAQIPRHVGRGRWMLDMPRDQQFVFRAAIASAPAFARQLTRSFDARTRVRVLERTQCGRLYSCAIGIVTESAGTRTARYSLELLARDFDGSEAARFLVLHEVGHLVDYEGITPNDSARFAAAFRASPAWKDCFPHEGGCVAMDELFADQFAIYATGVATSLTTYATPRLLSNARFEALLRATYLR